MTVIRLTSGSENVPYSLVFGELFKLATPVVNHYHSDLYHDALWLAEHLAETRSFYFGVRDTGTSIGTDPELVSYSNTLVYRCELANDRNRWDLTITRALVCGCDPDTSEPCESHYEILVQREGASVRTSDELQHQMIIDLLDLGATLSTTGQLDLASIRWDTEHRNVTDDVHRRTLDHLEHQLTEDLATVDVNVLTPTQWHIATNDGYTIGLITGPLTD